VLPEELLVKIWWGAMLTQPRARVSAKRTAQRTKHMAKAILAAIAVPIFILGGLGGALFLGPQAYRGAQWIASAVHSRLIIHEALPHITQIYSELERTRITEFLTGHIKLGETSLLDCRTLCSRLMEEFPLIEHATCSRKISGAVELHIFGAQPCLLINEAWVADTRGRLHARTAFSECNLDQLGNISLQGKLSEETFISDVFQILAQLTEEQTNRYKAEFVDREHIYLHTKETAQPHSVLASASSLSDQSKWAQLKNARNQATTAFSRRARHNRALLFDIRFANQIVIGLTGKGKGS
jgi:hypothetical protein